MPYPPSLLLNLKRPLSKSFLFLHGDDDISDFLECAVFRHHSENKPVRLFDGSAVSYSPKVVGEMSLTRDRPTILGKMTLDQLDCIRRLQFDKRAYFVRTHRLGGDLIIADKKDPKPDIAHFTEDVPYLVWEKVIKKMFSKDSKEAVIMDGPSREAILIITQCGHSGAGEIHTTKLVMLETGIVKSVSRYV